MCLLFRFTRPDYPGTIHSEQAQKFVAAHVGGGALQQF